MYKKTAYRQKINPWGFDNPEKARDSDQTLNFSSELKNQMSGFVNPDNWFSQILGKTPVKESFSESSAKEKTQIKRRETLIFSRAESMEEANLRRETQIIMEKLKEQVVLLEKSEKNLAADVGKVKVEQLPQKSGIYYVRFLEWMLTLVKQLRIKVEEGRAWLATFNQRKKKRLGYWQMYKKHGTTFGLSQERTLATQTG